MQGTIAEGWLVGDGAAQNVSLGWYPTKVEVYNVTGGDVVTYGFLAKYTVPFSSGGTTEIEVGDKIKGATTGATARVAQILSYSGTWAGGDAAGFFVVDAISGTFGSENVYVDSDDTTGINDATVTVNVIHSMSIDTEVATVGTTSAISRYAGSSSAAIGFTIGSVVSEEANLLRWIAYRAV